MAFSSYLGDLFVLCKGHVIVKKEIAFSSLKSLRIKHGLTQSGLAEELGTTKTAVSRWERNVAVPSSYFQGKLCTFFETTTEDLGGDQLQEVFASFKQLQIQYTDIQMQLTRIESELGQLTGNRSERSLGGR